MTTKKSSQSYKAQEEGKWLIIMDLETCGSDGKSLTKETEIKKRREQRALFLL